MSHKVVPKSDPRDVDVLKSATHDSAEGHVPLLSVETGAIKEHSSSNDNNCLDPTLEPCFIQHSKYRPDLDGLRAIALILVVLFHANVPFIQSGFVGVDVFFVLSGFLICISIGRDLTRKKFSFAAYYTRRLWRLQPTFLVMIIFTLVASYFLADTNEIHKILASASWATILSGNSYFANLNGGYFADDVKDIPLIHTWSLAVEWKWYLLFPVLLSSVNRVFGTAGMKSFIIVCSFVTTTITVLFPTSIFIFGKPDDDYIQSSHYYSFILRIFEMAIGSAAAIVPLSFLDHFSLKVRLISGAISLVSIPVLSFFPLANGYPNVMTLVVCLFTVVVILVGSPSHSHGDSIASKNYCTQFLSSHFLVYIGKISYSIYLFHWPLLWACGKLLIASQSPIFIILYVAGSVAIAHLSYYYVEKFCLRFNKVHIRSSFFLLILAPAAAVYILQLECIINKGFPQRFPDEYRRYDRLNNNLNENGSVIFADYDHTANLGQLAHFDAPKEQINSLGLKDVPINERTILYAGDSHALHSNLFILENTRDLGLDVDLYTAGECLLLPGTYQPNVHHCNEHKEMVSNLIDKKYKYVALAHFWTLYLQEDLKDHSYNKLTTESGDILEKFDDRRKAMETSLLKIVKKIVSVGSIPMLFGDFYDQSQYNSLKTNRRSFINCLLANYKSPGYSFMKSSCDTRDNRSEDYIWVAVQEIFAKVKKQYPTTILYDYSELQCDGTICHAEVDNFPLLIDSTGHLTDYASYYLGHMVKESNNPFLKQ